MQSGEEFTGSLNLNPWIIEVGAEEFVVGSLKFHPPQVADAFVRVDICNRELGKFQRCDEMWGEGRGVG